MDRTHSALECLREVSEVLPGDVTLNTFTYKKGLSLVLRGEAPAANTVYDYYKALDQSTLFESKRTDPVTTKMQDNVMKAQFGVTLILPGDKS
ncbi:MAG: PilN domain-containing protein, partial [Lentisphaerota bacterium]